MEIFLELFDTALSFAGFVLAVRQAMLEERRLKQNRKRLDPPDDNQS
jgi:mannose/fructose/N-acetylgalactosamine-specific phosphotransferase system component IID